MTPQAVAVQRQTRGAIVAEDNNEDRLGAVQNQLAKVDSRLDGVENRLAKVEGRLDGVENRLVKVESRLDGVENRLIKVEGRLERVEDRVARVESDVIELKRDVRGLDNTFKDFKIDVAKEFGAMRAEFKTSLGSLQTSIERTKVWMITTGVSTVLAVAAIVGFRAH